MRILAIEQYGAGPWGSLQLAELGAEVIKIEDPSSGGDVGRYIPPFQEGEDSLFFETFNRNKRSISLDITNPAGRRVFEDLVRHSDAVYANLRGDVPGKLRIRYEDLAHLNPAIVCCSLSGFGMTGPRASNPGYDYILQALAGWMELTGEPGSPPTKTGPSLVDYSGGYVAAIALLAGLHGARRDGIGSDCDVSLYDNALSLLTYIATWSLTAGFKQERTRHSAHPSLVPFQNFQTADGWLVVGCAKEKFWVRLCKALGMSDLAEDPRFDSFAARTEHRDELLALLEAEFRTETTEKWLKRLDAADVPCAPILSLADALAEPHAVARQMIVEVEHPVFGKVRQLATPVRVGPPGEDTPTYRRAPKRNEDADYVLTEIIGYDSRVIDELSSSGAFGVLER